MVLWPCRKFTRSDLEALIEQLREVLAGREPEIHPRDDFRQQNPRYRDFYVDPQAPLTQPPIISPLQPKLDWRQLRTNYQRAHARPLTPVKRRGGHATHFSPPLEVCEASNSAEPAPRHRSNHYSWMEPIIANPDWNVKLFFEALFLRPDIIWTTL